MGPFFLLLSSLTWAIGGSTYSRLSREYTPIAINFSRAVFAIPFLLAVALFRNHGPAGAWLTLTQVPWTNLAWLLSSMLSSYLVGDAFFYWSTRSLGIPGALSIACTYPLFNVAFTVAFGDHVPATSQILGTLVVIASVILVILNAPGVEESKAGSQKVWVGVVFAICAAGAWSMNVLSVSRGARGIDTEAANLYRMTFATLLCFSASKVLARGKPFMLPFSVLKRTIWVFVAEAFLGSFFYLYGLSHTPLVVGSVLSSLAPVMSVPIAWIGGMEKPSWARTLGVCGVIFGLWLVLRVQT
jgi:drug/metabolite transporter (DMT)-like permease